MCYFFQARFRIRSYVEKPLFIFIDYYYLILESVDKFWTNCVEEVSKYHPSK